MAQDDPDRGVDRARGDTRDERQGPTARSGTRLFWGLVAGSMEQGWSVPQFAFRKSLAFKGKVGAMATWLRLGELSAQKIECKPFDRPAFQAALNDIRTLTVAGPGVFVPRMTERCAASGVAVSLVPEIKGAAVSGAAKWLTADKAMICLNLRGKCNDRFWFTFFHEAGHILNDSKKETFIDVDYQDDPREERVNRFAASILIPPTYEKELRGLSSYHSVEAFAQRIGVAAGIVVGRLQCEAIIRFNQFNGLKKRFEWVG